MKKEGKGGAGKAKPDSRVIRSAVGRWWVLAFQCQKRVLKKLCLFTFPHPDYTKMVELYSNAMVVRK